MTVQLNIHDQSKINIYDEYGIITDDSESEDDIIINTDRPSDIVKCHSNMNDNSDTDSDDYDDNNIIITGRRRHSFIKRSLSKFSSRVDVLPDPVKKVFTNNTNQNSYYSILKNKTLISIYLITGIAVSFILLF